MSLLRVEDALDRLLRDVSPVGSELVPLADAGGRVLAADLVALRTQPPFPASAMDGYAVRAADAAADAMLTVIGESRAGKRFPEPVGAMQAVRIFTGAPVPDGADSILIQENAERMGDRVRVLEPVARGRSIRPEGLDFQAGGVLLRAGRRLDAPGLALAAAMGHAALPVRRRPRVAILANGDELVRPGQEPGPDQIVSSNNVGIAAFVRECGGEPLDLGIAPDREEAIGHALEAAGAADVLVVIGGASVGDHDLTQAALAAKGMTLDFWKIAMRPGKPLIVGSLRDARVLGLPGNPVSAFVCARVFLKPLLRTLLGQGSNDPATRLAPLGTAMAANDGRQDYVRARLDHVHGEAVVSPFPVQDSSMLSTLAEADALVVRPPHAPAAAAGDRVPILILREQA